MTIKLFINLICIFISFSSFSKTNALSQKIENHILKHRLKKRSLGLIVSKIKKNGHLQTLYQLNSTKKFTPASLAKIATVRALYSLYPEHYTFNTLLLASAVVKNQILKGDLTLKGSGDPSFTSESLWNLVNSFSRSGIKKIQGNMLVDESLYKKTFLKPSSNKSYHAITSASSFNWNSISIRIRPNKKQHKKARVFIDPENDYIQIVNRVKTGTKNNIVIKKNILKTKEVFTVSGEISITKKEIVKYTSISAPALYLGYNVLSFLNHRGIRLDGQVKQASCRGTCKVFAQHKSRPLSFHIYNLMKYSNNFIAQMLVSHLPIFKKKPQGDMQQGMRLIRNYLKTKEHLKHFTLLEPSGLSVKNKFRPIDLQQLLTSSKQAFYGPEILSSYPIIAGVGTLEKKLHNIPKDLNIRAKTGSLSKVLGLAGFATNKNQNYVFVFLFNGKSSKKDQALGLFNNILKFL